MEGLVFQEEGEKLEDRELLSKDEEEEDQNLNYDNRVMIPDVKSDAVIKFETVKTPAKFIELQRNTDLKEAPSNWLLGGSKWENFLRGASLGKDHSFSSFNMAHSYPDLAGSIDVISDSANIKKLLKVPYSKNNVSMMVHRVGDTLLLEDFDIHKHLLRKQETDWEWVRKFFQETVMESDRAENAKVVKKNKSRDHLQNRNMFSKFLYYSIAQDDIDGGLELQSERPPSGSMERSFEVPDLIPDPLSKVKIEDADHMRTVLWNFEDIHMLIGTDLPIFGGTTHPCVSLRLRDMKKPINVLTGLDYWLDNLMCNVPEIAMCYHLDGIVQGYELFKTEDIPHLKNSQFSPSVIKDVAQNILSFLKSNATKEGHTYWLFKGHGDDVVKLYDLTTLCEPAAEGQQNPFTIPVAVLLYRVARNMRQTAGRKKSTTIWRLLQNSLLLLGDDLAYSQVVTSAHYLLSDLYLSDNIYDLDQNVKESEESDADEEESEVGAKDSDKSTDKSTDKAATNKPAAEAAEEHSESFVAVQSLVAHRQESFQKQVTTKQNQPITGPLSDRCAGALHHVALGLNCLDQNAADHLIRSKHKVDQQSQPNPNEAIPLHYQPINIQRDKMSQVSVMDNSRPRPFISLPEGTWHKLSKTLMLKKAAIAYHGMCETSLADLKYGTALKFANLGLMCIDTMGILLPKKQEENVHIMSALLSLAGDAHLQLMQIVDQDFKICREEYKDFSEDDMAIMNSINLDLRKFELRVFCELKESTLECIQLSIKCYREAISKGESVLKKPEAFCDIRKRLGNALNVLGIHYMNKASHLLNASKDSEVDPGPIKLTCETSLHSLQESLSVFLSANDVVNAGLIHSNIGRLMRLLAQVPGVDTSHKTNSANSQSKTRELSNQEKSQYVKAIEQYLQAIKLLEGISSCQSLMQSIKFELSRTYFNLATLMQDYAPLSRVAEQQVEKEVTHLMMQSLKYCDVEASGPRQKECEYQAATIHHRLASLYQNAYRNQVQDDRKRHLRLSAEAHYDKATEFFSVTDHPCELLRLTLERYAMNEFHLQRQTSHQKKFQTLLLCLQLLVSCKPYVQQVLCLNTPPDDSTMTQASQSYQQEAEKLIPILYSRLQSVLLNLLKTVAPSGKKSKSSDNADAKTVRSLYDKFLKLVPVGWDKLDIFTRCQHLGDILQMLEESTPGVK